MSLLVTATLASALAGVFGGILLVRRADARSASPETAPNATEASPEATTPLGRLKGVIQAGDWGAALPSLLALGGILGVMLFGALALIFALDQARSGWPMLILAILTIGWAVREYVRA